MSSRAAPRRLSPPSATRLTQRSTNSATATSPLARSSGSAAAPARAGDVSAAWGQITLSQSASPATTLTSPLTASRSGARASRGSSRSGSGSAAGAPGSSPFRVELRRAPGGSIPRAAPVKWLLNVEWLWLVAHRASCDGSPPSARRPVTPFRVGSTMPHGSVGGAPGCVFSVASAKNWSRRLGPRPGMGFGLGPTSALTRHSRRDFSSTRCGPVRRGQLVHWCFVRRAPFSAARILDRRGSRSSRALRTAIWSDRGALAGHPCAGHLVDRSADRAEPATPRRLAIRPRGAHRLVRVRSPDRNRTGAFDAEPRESRAGIAATGHPHRTPFLTGCGTDRLDWTALRATD